MKSRICIQQDIHSSKAMPCSVDELIETMKSPRVQQICDNILALQINNEHTDKDLVNAYKRQLPAITPHACRFADNKRSSKNAVSSNLAMLDVDNVESPALWWKEWQRIAEDAENRSATLILKEAKVYLVAKTPSAHGLRIIAERQPKESIPNAAERLARLFGFTSYDACTKDLARLSYLMPWSYVYYFDRSGFELPNDAVTDTANEQIANEQIANSQMENKTIENEPIVNKNKNFPLYYEDIPYTDIVRELELILGGKPKHGERNNTLFSIALNIRYICDFNPDFIASVLPSYGLSSEEVAAIANSAATRTRRNQLPEILERALATCRQNNEDQDCVIDHSDLDPDALTIPRLPRLLNVITRKLPEVYRPAMLIASLPVLGTLATSVRFNYLDGQQHSFSFLACIASPAATGKSFLRKPLDLLLTPINRQDEEERNKERVYKENLRAARNKKEQPEDPHACPRNNGINISVAALLKLLTYNNEKHLIAIGEEIDTLAKSEKAGVWSQKSDIYRLAFDNATYGQQYISDNSFSANVKVFYNLLVTGTTGGMYRFFSDVENGLVTRVAFATLPDMFATPIPRFEDYTEAERNYIVTEAERLTAENGFVECQKVTDAMAKWQEEKRLRAEQTDDRALDIVRRRAGVIGFRAGMLAYVLNSQRNAKQAADFALWVAEYVFRQQMSLFGKQFEDAFYQSQKIIDTSRGRVVNLLQALPQTFSRNDLIAQRLKIGQSTNVRNVISRWRKAGYIEDLGNNNYKILKRN